LEDVTLYLVDLIRGKACDFRTFKTDRISLSHNQGVYLFRDTLAILSVQHQEIHLIKVSVNPVTGTAEFQDIRNIGRFCFEDDEFLVSSATIGNRRQVRPFRETCMTALKHRILTFLYKKAKDEVKHDPKALLKFFKQFDFLSKLKMWKLQLFDERHILIKYAPEEVVNLRSPDIRSLFVVYDVHRAIVLDVFENHSIDLYRHMELYCDVFRNPTPALYCNTASSPSNSFFAYAIQRRCVQALTVARNGGCQEARRRIMLQLPVAAQSFTPTPYLDHNLFAYDEKWINALERPKAGCDHPIKFYERESGYLRFSLMTGNGVFPDDSSSSASPTDRKLAAFIFHPFDPFVITVQRSNSDYVVNIHIRQT
jgi:de-etiolated-1